MSGLVPKAKPSSREEEIEALDELAIDLLEKLTPKQLAFAEYLTFVEDDRGRAYEHAYNTPKRREISRRDASAMGGTTANTPSMKKYLRTIRRRWLLQSDVTAAELQAKAMDIHSETGRKGQKGYQPAVALKSLEFVARLNGMLQETTPQNTQPCNVTINLDGNSQVKDITPQGQNQLNIDDLI